MLLLNTIDGDVRAAPSLKRADLLRLPEPPNLSPIRLQIHRNYAFELVGSVLGPFLWLSGLKSSIAYGDYDDSLSFARIDPVAIQPISLDFERYGETAGSASFREWFAGRLMSLRGITDRPIVAANWASEERRALEFNRELKRSADELPSVFVWDIVEILRNLDGRFFDERAAAAKGTRLSNSACIEMARSLGLVQLPSVLLPRIKAIAVDLDNTLFDGVLGEDGVEGVRIRAEHEAIYKELLRLRGEGVFLAALSKNDERDFMKLCEERADFLLKPAHFSASSVGWRPKPEGLASIAEQLHIGVDSILVVDDNVGEIAQLCAAHAETPLLHSQSPGADAVLAAALSDAQRLSREFSDCAAGERSGGRVARTFANVGSQRRGLHSRDADRNYIRVELEECAREAGGAFAKNQSVQHGVAALLRSTSRTQAGGTGAVRDFSRDARQVLRQRHHRSDFC